MAESSLRRHLAALVGVGLIVRHDSPNGKRYARKDTSGTIVRAFGFDLRPLILRATEISNAAAEAHAAADSLKRRREQLTLVLRDCRKYIEFGLSEDTSSVVFSESAERCAHLCRTARRKLDGVQLAAALEMAEALLDEVLGSLRTVVPAESEKMSGNDGGFERHHHSSNTHTLESDCLETKKEAARPTRRIDRGYEATRDDIPDRTRIMPFQLVRDACKEIRLYARNGARDWHDFVGAAHFVRGMMGISASAWRDAIEAMGEVSASVAVACILERADEIRTPGGYLRRLTTKAESVRSSVYE
jgi:replication initiation protein RepC